MSDEKKPFIQRGGVVEIPDSFKAQAAQNQAATIHLTEPQLRDVLTRLLVSVHGLADSDVDPAIMGAVGNGILKARRFSSGEEVS
jgi:hypothetical protein